MAPEGAAARRSGSLGALSFADRLLSPYVTRAHRSPVRMFGVPEEGAAHDADPTYEVEPTSWIFPRPWYQDELGWLQAARVSAATTATGSAARPGRVATATASGQRAAGSPARGASVALDLVAPSFGRGSLASAEGVSLRRAGARTATATATPARSAPTQSALRAWSPLVSFSAVQAAELMAGVFMGRLDEGGRAAAEGDAGAALAGARVQPAPLQELVAPLVAPRDLAAAARPESVRVTSRAQPAPVSETLRNRLNNALRRIEVRRAQSPASAPASPAAAAAEGSAATTTASASTADSSRSTSGASAPGAAATSPVPASERALELMVRSALAGGASMAPVTGPRLALPSGLGGLVAGVHAARAVTRPMSMRRPVAPATGPAVSAAARAAQSPVAAPVVRAGQAAALPLVGLAPSAAPDAGQDTRRSVVPSVPPAAAPFAPARATSGSAYRAITMARPAALGHIAWADRWLARFAGASTDTLTTLEMTTRAAAGAQPGAAMQAPEPVFLQALAGQRPGAMGAPSAGAGAASVRARAAGTATRPGLDASIASATASTTAGKIASSSPSAGAATGAGPTAPAVRPGVTDNGSSAAGIPAAPRIDDDESVPDEVFAAIAAAAARAPRRATGGAASTRAPEADAPQPAPVTEPSAPASPAFIDRLLATGPRAPGPGMRVALASSPVAPALSALLPLPPSPSFDVRAMHGVELAQAYLLGLVEPDAAARAGAASSWPLLDWLSGTAAAHGAEPGPWTQAPAIELLAPARPFVAPATQDAARSLAASGALASRDTAAGATRSAGQSSDPGRTTAVGSRLAAPGSLLPVSPAIAASVLAGTAPANQTSTAGRGAPAAPGTGTGTGAMPVGLSHAPGLAATRAESWAVAREQHAADLALDFVSPELILAAHAYGFGAAEAVQAARLSAAGRTGLAALATAVDLRFLDSFAAARSGEPLARGAAPGAGSTGARHAQPAPARSAAVNADMRPVNPAASAASAPSPVAAKGDRGHEEGPRPSPATLDAPAVAPGFAHGDAVHAPVAGAGSARLGWGGALGASLRMPRGAFLWPQATAVAMDLQAAEADTAQPLSLAALDLLAASAVAQMGVLVTAEPANDGARRASMPAVRTASGAAPAASMALAGQETPARPARLASSIPLAPDMPGAGAPRDSMLATGAPPATYVTPVLDLEEPAGAIAGAAAGATGAPVAAPGQPGQSSDIVDTPAAAAAALGATSQLPAELEALYVALSRSPAGRSLSPAVRAARALALARTTGSRGSASSRARAAAVWAVMPMVLTGGATDAWASDLLASPDSAAGGTRDATARPELVRPELEAVTARAGESLQAFVAPGAAAEPPRSGTGAATRAASQGAVHRAPSAAQPLVQTSSQSSASTAAVQDMIRAARQKRASGDAGIPPWFEEAARRMFEDGSGEGISLAEMTLVTAAPARQVAASARSASSSTPSRPPEATGGSESQDTEPTANVEQLAREVYSEICRMIEVARDRNGDTWR